MGGLPPVFVEFLGSSKGVKTAMADVKAELAVADSSGAGSFAKTGMLGKAAIAGIGIAAAGVAVATVKMAADFQTQMTRVRTGAGESAANMRLVGDGVLAMAGQVGQSTTELTAGLYGVESAGYHGTNALLVLKTAAMGAKVGAADLATTSDALTTAMNAYKMPADQATAAMNALIATEGQGKTNLEDLAGSMASILPTSAAAHVGLNEVLGAMATMTSQGTPAAVAATYLRQTIGMLSNPSSKAASEMKDLGLSAIQVSQNLGKHGLASTLTELTDAIEKKMGPAGTVLIQHLRDAAKHTTAYQKVLADLPPAQQTYIGALATMVGGTKSMQAALELTGPHMADFKNNTATIAEHVKTGGKSVEGWADVQKTFNQRMAEAKASAGALGIQIGNYLLPAVTAVAGVVANAVTWLTKHKQVAEALAIVIGGALVVALAAVTAALYEMAVAAATNPMTWIILAVVAVIAAIVLLALHWHTVWNGIKSVAETVGHFLVGVWDWIAHTAVSVWNSIVDHVVSAWNAIGAWLSGAWHSVADPIVSAWHWVANTTAEVWGGISKFFMRWWPLLLALFLPVIAAVMGIWNHFHTQIIGSVVAAWNTVMGALKTAWGLIYSAAMVVWAAIKAGIITPVMDVWHILMQIWSAVSGWLAGQWHSLEGVASAVWKQIKKAIIDPTTEMWHTLTSLMSKIGSVISGAFSGAWNTVMGFMGHWINLGGNIISGIVKGLEGDADAVGTWLKHMAEGALNTVKSFLGISSPSREFAKIGGYINAGLVQGLEGSAAQVQSATRRISTMLYSQFGADSHVGLQNLVRLDGQDLNRLATQRTAIGVRLKAANANLAALQKDWAKTQSSVAASIMQSVSVVTTAPTDGSLLSVDQVIGHMQDQVNRANQFAAELQQAQKNGLSSEMVQQIAAAGVDQGGATAQALATATKGQLQQINALQGSAKQAASGVGTAVADSMYASGIQSAQGLVRGLASQQAAIQRQMDKIATSMANTIKRALKIHSPSQVFAEIGTFVSQGLGAGIDSGAHHAVTAAAALAGAVTAAGVPTLAHAAGMGPGQMVGYQGSQPVANLTTIVELDGEVLFRAVQPHALLFDRRNPQAGLVYTRN